jgi:adenine phosphoribosyltransferase
VTIELLKACIRDVPDFPKPGILFKDITPLLADPRAFRETISHLCERIGSHGVEGIVAIESRGFILGAPVAVELGLPLQLVRKPGKLPYDKIGVEYQLEYGTDRVEMHVDAIARGARYAVVDDLIATGGTAAATIDLIEQHGGVIGCCAFVIELSFLEGQRRLGDHPVESLIRY